MQELEYIVTASGNYVKYMYPLVSVEVSSPIFRAAGETVLS